MENHKYETLHIIFTNSISFLKFNFSEGENKDEESEQNKKLADDENTCDKKEDSSIDNPQEDMKEENEVEERFEDEL